MKEYAKQFYSSQPWQKCRNAYKKSVGGLCEDCLARGIYKAGDIVHHIKHITPSNINDPSITLNWDNLKLVCMQCHSEEHKQTTNRRYTVDEFGNVILR